MVGAVLQARQKYGIKTRIAHAHLAYVNNPSFVKRMYNSVLKVGLRRYATDFFACSKDAGRYLFGDKILEKSNFRVLPNAIDTKSYSYNPSTRKRIRNEFGIADTTFAVGFVGRLYYQKNPERMLSIFNEICKLHPDSHLVIVGDYKSYAKFDGLKNMPKRTDFPIKLPIRDLEKMCPMLCRHLTHLFFRQDTRALALCILRLRRQVL